MVLFEVVGSKIAPRDAPITDTRAERVHRTRSRGACRREATGRHVWDTCRNATSQLLAADDDDNSLRGPPFLRETRDGAIRRRRRREGGDFWPVNNENTALLQAADPTRHVQHDYATISASREKKKSRGDRNARLKIPAIARTLRDSSAIRSFPFPLANSSILRRLVSPRAPSF